MNPGAGTFIKMLSGTRLMPKNPKLSGTAFLSHEAAYIGYIDLIWVITVLEDGAAARVLSLLDGATESQGRRKLLHTMLYWQPRASPTSLVLL